MSDDRMTGLPVAGYHPQARESVVKVNAAKLLEERVLRHLDALAGHPDTDKRWLALARTNIELGFMAANRAVFRPGRIGLPDDEDGA